MKLKVHKKSNSNAKRQYKVDKLNDQDIRTNFPVDLKNSFALLDTQNFADGSGTVWLQMTNTYDNVAKEHLGYKKKPKESWMAQETWKLIEEHNNLRQGILSTDGNKSQSLQIYITCIRIKMLRSQQEETTGDI